MRKRFAELLFNESIKDPNIFLLTGDLGYGVLDNFMEKIPSQFINCGISEQSMIGIAGGMASMGKKIFVYSIANFPTFRCLEQIRNDLVYMGNNVTVVSVGAGFSYGSQGYTHHGIEDMSIIRCLGNTKIFSPADSDELDAVFPIIMNSKVTTYLRLGKGGETPIHKEKITNIGEPILFWSSNKGEALKSVCILTCGTISSEVITAANSLSEFCNFDAYSSPILDKERLGYFLSKINYDLVVTLEEHVIAGGFGSFILEVKSDLNLDIRVKNIGVNPNNLKINGTQGYLRSQHKIDSDSITNFIKQNL
jgi:transketolase